MDLKKAIRTVPDFPEKGIMFMDITTVLHDKDTLRESIDLMCDEIKDLEFDYILGPESRGFIYGVPVAYNLNKGFIPIRKAGKLPSETIKKQYSLEYGEATIEMHVDALKKGDKVIILDDLLATGGTCKAIAELVEEVGASVECMLFFIELMDLKGRDILSKYDIKSIVKYD